jgi:8-oxo-dGTP diphosphatase
MPQGEGPQAAWQSDEGLTFCPRCGAHLAPREIDGRPRPQCERCGFIWYHDPKVAAGTLPVTADGRLVLVRRGIEPQRGRWTFPGGYMDRGETVPAAAVRETWEECRLSVEPTGLVGVYSYTTSIVVVVIYAARITGGALAAGPECLEARAFAPGELPWGELAFSSTRDALQDYLGRGAAPLR